MSEADSITPGPRNVPPENSRAGDELLITLWEETVSQYRQKVRPSQVEENLLDRRLSVEELYQSSLDQWESFSRPNEQSNIFKAGMKRTLEVLQTNITSIDAIIGYPSQAVPHHFCFC